MVAVLKSNKNTIYHDIYIKVFSDVTVSYIIFSTDDVLNPSNNEISFTELPRVFQEIFHIQVQEGYVLTHLNFRLYQSALGFSVDQTDQIMELVNE